jgi:hypothetical protein
LFVLFAVWLSTISPCWFFGSPFFLSFFFFFFLGFVNFTIIS